MARVEIVTDCAPCRTTFERLGELSTRGWMRLPNRWIWRAVWAETARRREGGQVIVVSWVRAHTEGEDPDSRWNDVADHFAKEAADDPAPPDVRVPVPEMMWVALHERRAITSDVSKFVGILHGLRSSRDLDNGKWMPLQSSVVDQMALACVAKAGVEGDMQSKAVRLWHESGLRTVGKMVAMDPESKLAEWLPEGGPYACPLCEGRCSNTEHILTECPVVNTKRAELVASFLERLSSFGRWGWWRGDESRSQELRRAMKCAREWCEDHGLSAHVEYKKGVVTAKVKGTVAPFAVWKSLVDSVQLTGVVAAARDLAKRAAEKGAPDRDVRQLPTMLVGAIMDAFRPDTDFNAAPYSRRHAGAWACPAGTHDPATPIMGSEGQFLGEEQALCLRGRRVVVRHSGGADAKKGVKRYQLATKADASTRLMVVVEGVHHDAVVAAAAKAGGKVLITWPTATMPMHDLKAAARGHDLTRRRTGCARGSVSLVMWENHQCKQEFAVSDEKLDELQGTMR